MHNRDGLHPENVGASYKNYVPCCRVTFEEATKGGQKTFTIKTKQGDQTVSMHIPAGTMCPHCY